MFLLIEVLILLKFEKKQFLWQVMVKQNTGELVCVAEDEDRFTLGEAKEEMLVALGLADEDDSPMKFLRSGYKTNTWWEAEDDREQSDAWRTQVGLEQYLG